MQLLNGVTFDEHGQVRLTRDPYDHIVEIVAHFASRRVPPRRLEEGEREVYASLAKPVLAKGRPFVDAVRVPLRAILTSPDFLFQAADSDRLDSFALASRLSYFLWRSMPDAMLFDVARKGRLSNPTVLAQEVDRMLDDAKNQRFVKDFAGQAFRLYDLKATAPDPGLYPEYDDRLGQAMRAETELFLAALIAENHGVGKLIDADFTFLNRRLAEHYGIPGVKGQRMRKVALPEKSPRGGLLTQASIHKVTANGTSTSPVRRGNFVLTKPAGHAPAPTPARRRHHRARYTGNDDDPRAARRPSQDRIVQSLSPCDRPARVRSSQSFDPIGGFRTRYRVSGGQTKFGDFTVRAPYRQGLPVDASGVTVKGVTFAGIEPFQRILLEGRSIRSPVT